MVVVVKREKKEILADILKLKKDLFNIRMNSASDKLKDLSIVKKTKKSIARLFTELNFKGNKNV